MKLSCSECTGHDLTSRQDKTSNFKVPFPQVLIVVTIFFIGKKGEKKWDLYPASLSSASTSASVDISGSAFHSFAATHGDLEKIRKKKTAKGGKSDFFLCMQK